MRVGHSVGVSFYLLPLRLSPRIPPAPEMLISGLLEDCGFFLFFLKEAYVAFIYTTEWSSYHNGAPF